MPSIASHAGSMPALWRWLPAKLLGPSGWLSSVKLRMTHSWRRALFTRCIAWLLPDPALWCHDSVLLLLVGRSRDGEHRGFPCSACSWKFAAAARAAFSPCLVNLSCPLSMQEFLAYFDTTVERETASAELAPFSLLYTSTVLATVHGRAFYEGTPAVHLQPMTTPRHRCSPANTNR